MPSEDIRMKRYVFSSKEEIIKGLSNVLDDRDIVQILYPRIADNLMPRRNAVGIALIFTNEAANPENKGLFHEQIWLQFLLQIPELIDAVVDDEEIAQAAKDLFQIGLDASIGAY